MAVALNQHTELNPVQVSLLRLFNTPMSEKETLEIRKFAGRSLYRNIKAGSN